VNMAMSVNVLSPCVSPHKILSEDPVSAGEMRGLESGPTS